MADHNITITDITLPSREARTTGRTFAGSISKTNGVDKHNWLYFTIKCGDEQQKFRIPLET